MKKWKFSEFCKNFVFVLFYKKFLKIMKLNNYINDFSGRISENILQKYNEIFSRHEKNTTEQIVTVFIKSRNGRELKDIALEIFNENKIGQKDLNNWLLLIIATDEKKIRIMTGKWMELKYTEMICRDIIEGHLRSLLENENWEVILQKWSEITTNFSYFKKEKRQEIIYINKEKLKRNQNFSFLGLSMFIWILGVVMIFVIPSIVVAFFLGILPFFWFCILFGFASRKQLWLGSKIVLAITTILTIFLWFVVSDTKTDCLPPDSNDVIHCSDTTIFGTRYYSKSNSHSSSDSSDSYYSSSDSDSFSSSSSSSFGGGGGSSNGGGYGD